jgi:hypothetical protein
MAFVRNSVLQAILICAFLISITCVAGAQASDINIPRHLKLGECSTTPENTYKVCRDMEGKYRTWPIADKGTKKGTTEKDRLMGNYLRCLYRSLGRGEVWTAAFHNCLDTGIELCNSDGLPTSKNYDISSITGRVRFSNDQCGIMLNSLYAQAEHSFINEYQNYSRSEAVGAPYTPITLDIREYVGQQAQTNDETTPQVSCNDIGENGSPNYWRMMTKLASIAKLNGGEFNRENEGVVAAFCSGEPKNIENVNHIVDYGYISAQEAEAIARTLGRQYKAPKRTEAGKNYERVKVALSNLGFCAACADSLATEYVKSPRDKKSKLVDAALAGDANAIKQLEKSQNNLAADGVATIQNASSGRDGLLATLFALACAAGLMVSVFLVIKLIRKK